MVNDPASVEHITSGNFDNFVKGDFMSSKLFELFGNGIFNSDGKNWHFQRKVGSKIFTTNAFKKLFNTVFMDNIGSLLNILSSASLSNQPIDIHDIFHRFFLDSFGKIAFGVNLECLSMKEDPFATSFDRSQRALVQRFFNPLWKLSDYLNPIHTRDIAFVRDVGYKMIQQRKNSQKVYENDLLALFMNYRTEDGVELNDNQLVDQVINFIIAGRDTTAQALSWTVYHLQKTPRVTIKLLEEMNSVMEPEQMIPTYEQVKTMKYANAVFRESLRLRPSVPAELKVAVEDDVLPNGTVIQAGVVVGWLPYSMGRNESIWGSNACEFQPERFLTGKTYSQYEYPVFNSGPRICLGKTLAELQGALVLTSILRQFKLEVENVDKVTYAPSLTLPIKDGLFCKVSRRL
ncbi:Protein kinase alk2 [Globomyces sp. JEL0801]|nr:Protein kinase alk2 [Globomyces sp. JEL0801]